MNKYEIITGGESILISGYCHSLDGRQVVIRNNNKAKRFLLYTEYKILKNGVKIHSKYIKRGKMLTDINYSLFIKKNGHEHLMKIGEWACKNRGRTMMARKHNLPRHHFTRFIEENIIN